MRSIVVWPSATRPARINDADARRSVAITGAPLSLSTPRTIAVWPSTRMSAPMRSSSCTCMKRFSKIVSLITPTPVATQFIAMNCACMSVGNPGCGAVVKLTACGRRPRMSSVMRSPAQSIVAPASLSLSITASSVSGRACVAVMCPPVIAAAMRNVPVSIRSGTTACAPPCRRSTPSMTMRPVPAPSIRAPIVVRHCARSMISGSIAAFSSTVRPSARVAAISTFSVAPTLTMSNTTRAPRRRFAVALTKPWSTLTWAPSACMPLRCWSIGREPIAQPPGSDTSAAPYFASSGPRTSTEARMVLTSSYGAT